MRSFFSQLGSLDGEDMIIPAICVLYLFALRNVGAKFIPSESVENGTPLNRNLSDEKSGSNGLWRGNDTADVRGWLSLSMTDVELRWEEEGARGYLLVLGAARWTLMADHPWYTLAGLRPNHVYSATLILLESHETHTLHFSTPTLLTDETKKNPMKENMLKSCPGSIELAEVAFTVKLEVVGTDKEGLVLEVVDSSSSRPLQWMDVPSNSSIALLTGLPPNTFLKLTLKQVDSSRSPMFHDIVSKTVFTGGCVPVPPSNLTRTLDLFLDLFPNKIGGSHYNVRCYADDDVFSGFPCHNSDMCVPLNWMCDKDHDCPDGDDEHDCGLSAYHSNSYCRKTEFRCVRRKQHVCLPIRFLCDGRKDCTDGWDEDPRNCRHYYGRPGGVHYQGGATGSCRHSYFRCLNNHGCVAPKFICDGESDCADGSDEWNCGSDYDCDDYKEFQCFQSYGKERCIPRSWMCDDQDDCAHGEDEDFDVCRRVL